MPLLAVFEVGTLPSGSYILNIVLLDAENRSVAQQTRKFFMYNPGVQEQVSGSAVDLAYETSYYASLSEDELDEQITYAVIIATDNEEDRLKSSRNLDAKREALLEFWSKRDPDPNTPINEVSRRVFHAGPIRTRALLECPFGWLADRSGSGLPEVRHSRARCASSL